MRPWLTRSGAVTTIWTLGAATCLTLLATPAAAITGFSTNAYVNVRSTPSTAGQLVGVLNAGTQIAIACQASGSSFGGSAIWNRLEGGPYAGRYIHDYFVKETPYAQFDQRLPRCDTPYSTNAYVNVRSGPSTGSTLVGGLNGSSPVSISCQVLGTAWGGSYVWN